MVQPGGAARPDDPRRARGHARVRSAARGVRIPSSRARHGSLRPVGPRAGHDERGHHDGPGPDGHGARAWRPTDYPAWSCGSGWSRASSRRSSSAAVPVARRGSGRGRPARRARARGRPLERLLFGTMHLMLPVRWRRHRHGRRHRAVRDGARIRLRDSARPDGQSPSRHCAHVAFNAGGFVAGVIYVIAYRVTTGQLPPTL